MHPEECEAIAEAWRKKEERLEIRLASISHVIALAGGMKRKGGGKLTIEDFLPKSIAKKTSDPKAAEEKLKRQFMALAKLTESNGK